VIPIIIFKQIVKHIRLIAIAFGVLLVFVASIIIYNSFSNPRFSSEAVVTQLKSLNRWETASFSIEKVIDKGTSQNKFAQILFGDRILLIARGEVIGGFDLENITANSVLISGKSVIISLPQPQILVTRLDNKNTYVYDRQQGLLVQNNKDLESEARLSAENDIRAAACKEGILSKASDTARNLLTNILKGIGFSKVTINIPQGSC
jgi:hypothetical protein